MKRKQTAAAPPADEADRQPGHYVLRLYIAGASPRSMRAIVNTRKLCEAHLQGRYELEIIDLLQHPARAVGEQIIVTPTLVKRLPLPLRRFIGDLSQTESVLRGLNLRSA